MDYVSVALIFFSAIVSTLLISHLYTNKDEDKRSLPLIKSFQKYTRNYTYTCDGFAVDVVLKDVHQRNSNVPKSNLCVIGAGPKPMISNLIQYFERIYLIEPNNEFHEKWKQLDWYNNSNIIRIHDTFENVGKYIDPSLVKFQWMIASHIFYYIKQQAMDKHIKLFNKYLVGSEGKIIISLAKDNECDIAKLSVHLQPEYALCTNLKKCLNKNNMKFKIIQSTEEGDMAAQNKEQLLNIMSMHLSDYVIDNDEYQNIIRMDNSVLRKNVLYWIDNYMKVDPKDKNNVIYHQHTDHYVVQASH